MNQKQAKEAQRMAGWVDHFCLVQKDLDTLVNADVVIVLTGDGLGRLWHAWQRLREKEFKPLVFIVGPDNLVLKEREGIDPESFDAKDFRDRLVSWGYPSDKVVFDASQESKYTTGQAASIIAHAERKGWRTAVLVASEFHIQRAWRTVIQAVLRANLDLTVIPDPSRTLNFFEPNLTLQDERSGFWLFCQSEWPRIVQYSEKDPPDVAPIKAAYDYLADRGLLPLTPDDE